MSRNRVLSAAEAIYIGLAKDPSYRLNYWNFYAIPRVQSASYSYSLAYRDVREFGRLGRIDTIITEAPQVSFQFSYFPTDGATEKAMGFNVNKGAGALTSNSFVASLLQGDKGQNYFVRQTAEGTDALLVDNADGVSNDEVIMGIGNCFISNYSVEGSVGNPVAASVSFEAFNLKGDSGLVSLYVAEDAEVVAYANTLPSVNQFDGSSATGVYALPSTALGGFIGSTGYMASALRPGDILLEMTPKAGGKSLTSLGTSNVSSNAAHIQSFSLQVPLSRTVLQRLGNSFGYSREMNFPVELTFNISAVISELKEASVYEALFANEKYDLTLTIFKPNAGGDRAGAKAMIYKMNNFVLESESFSSSLDANKTADLTFKGQVGGPNDNNVGIFVSGSYASITGQSQDGDIKLMYVADADYPAGSAEDANGILLFP